MKSITTLVLVLITSVVYAQNPSDGRLFQKMDLGVDLMNEGKYALAEKEFLNVMNNMQTLPSELAFYFGKNSYYLQKYKQSINWLNKYIQLKGTTGRFYKEATEVLQKAEDEYLENSRKQQQNLQASLSSGEFDCGGLEKMICPVCKGEGVVLKSGPFDTIYQTCPYSNGEPYLSCEDYNKFMKGELHPKSK